MGRESLLLHSQGIREPLNGGFVNHQNVALQSNLCHATTLTKALFGGSPKPLHTICYINKMIVCCLYIFKGEDHKENTK